MMNHADLNYAWSRALFTGLHAAGVHLTVISPGSRSTPLALAACRTPGLQTRVILDERSAAFFALGAARAAGRPVALIATSGSAVAEWLPAVVEADMGRVPLILLSADRPPELHQCGANQTIEQTGLFARHCRFSHELPLPDAALFDSACRFASQAAAAANWPLPGPVHLNQPFREPLTPENFPEPALVRPPQPDGVSPPRLQPDPQLLEQIAGTISARPGLIVCGPESGMPHPAAALRRLAERLKAPILADPLANLRDGAPGGNQIISLYDLCLRSPDFTGRLRPEWVLHLGAQPVSKQLGEYLAGLASIEQILLDPHGRWPDPLHRTTRLVQADPELFCSALADRVEPADAGQVRLWQERQIAVERILDVEAPDERRLIETLSAHLPADALLFSGNSLPIRQLDWFHRGRPAPLRIVCNRGVSGIDGNIASLLGMASTHPGKLVGLLGDLTLLHDIGSLLNAREIDSVILVLDNGGGAIFDHLPQNALAEHERLFITPQQVDLAALAGGFGLGYCSTSLERLDQDLDAALQRRGTDLLHIRIDRQQSRQQHRQLWELLKE